MEFGMRHYLILCTALIIAAQPASAGVSDAQIAAAVRGSDDLPMHAEVFQKASKNLVDKGWCTLQDLRITGGWVRRPAAGRTQHRIYVTYCGGSAAKNRLYLDATSGRVYR
jgi:hypothetical protein